MKLNRLCILTFFFVSFPFFVFSQQPEDDQIRKFLITVPANISDEAAIDLLKAKNFSAEAKKQVTAENAFIIKRYKLALFMLDDGYAKPTDIGSFFSTPFSDGEKNTTIVSSQNYSQQELIKYIQVFMDKGLKLTSGTAIAFYNKPGREEIYEFFKSKLTGKEKEQFEQELLRQALYKEKVDINEVLTILKTTSAKVTPDIYVQVKLDNLEVVKLLFEKGADPNYTPADKSDTPLIVAVVFYVPEVVSFLLEKGADPCYKNSRGHDAIHRAKGGLKYCPDDKCKEDINKVIDLVKKAKKNC